MFVPNSVASVGRLPVSGEAGLMGGNHFVFLVFRSKKRCQIMSLNGYLKLSQYCGFIYINYANKYKPKDLN